MRTASGRSQAYQNPPLLELAGQLVPAGAAYRHGGSRGRGAEAAGLVRAPPRLPPVPAAYHRRESEDRPANPPAGRRQ